MSNKYIFYPGCSMLSTASPYLDSLTAIQEKMDMELVEVEDWNCCGATEYQAVHSLASHALVGRNLALAQEQANGSNQLMAACSACFLNLAKTDHYMDEDPDLNTLVNESLAVADKSYEPGSVEVRHLLDVVINDIGIEKIASMVTKPLKGLRVAAYYGCMIVRPDYKNTWESPEYPNVLEELMSALGAEVIDFSMKTKCCSGHMAQISPESAFEMIRGIVDGASKSGADLLVTLCPMCQLNLDAYQVEMNKFYKTDYEVPILYFTQMIGLALGMSSKELGIGKEFVNSAPALEKIGIEVPVIEEPKQRGGKKKEIGLPMPKMSNKDGKY